MKIAPFIQPHFYLSKWTQMNPTGICEITGDGERERLASLQHRLWIHSDSCARLLPCRLLECIHPTHSAELRQSDATRRAQVKVVSGEEPVWGDTSLTVWN